MTMMKRKLRVEVLEDRRVLSVVPLAQDGQVSRDFDPSTAGNDMIQLYEELGIDRVDGGMEFMFSMAEPETVAVELPAEEDIVPIEARHFVAVLRSIDEAGPPVEDGESSQGERGGEGEPSVMPERMRAGVARFFLNRGDTALRYRLRIPHLAGVDSATIRLGSPGEGGPAVATLFDLNVGELDGISLRGELTDNEISPAEELGFDGTLASLVQSLRDGGAYVEVATEDGAALRGAIKPLGWRPWQNPINRMDVTGDQNVTPHDALVVIEDLNENGARMVEAPMAGAPATHMYTDVSGDNLVSPRDALDLVQFLNDNAGELQSGGKIMPEAVSKTVDELIEALEIDPAEFADFDYEGVLEDVLGGDAAEVEDLVDRLTDGLQEEYEQHYSQWIGEDESFSMMEIDWEQLYNEYADEIGQYADKMDGLTPGFDQMMDEMQGMFDSWQDGLPPWQM